MTRVHPVLRQVLGRAARAVAFHYEPCGEGHPPRAVDVEPTTVSYEVLRAWVLGVALGRGHQVRHGARRPRYGISERCEHPGHFEID